MKGVLSSPIVPFVVLYLLFSTSLLATGDSTRFLLPTDSILLREDRLSGHLIFPHTLEEGQTLFGVAQFYGLRLDDLYYLNPQLKGGYTAGDEVKIACPSVILRTYISYDSIDHFVPVWWELQKGETIYGIVHRMLNLPNEEDLYFNNPGLDPSTLKLGQKLFIGWMPIAGISAEMQGEVEDPYVRMNTGMREQWERVSVGKQLKSATGKAAWTRDGDQNQFLALHRTAPINSLIEVMDKRTGKVIYCRVVGRIPDQVYDKYVQVVVSPLLVKAFGVRDRFFYVQVKHY
ncbi:MAG: LysM domain-containing protein [Bacteroidota bacterium]